MREVEPRAPDWAVDAGGMVVMAERRREFVVIEGGVSRPRLRMVVVDLDAPRCGSCSSNVLSARESKIEIRPVLADREAAVLRAARDVGLRLVVCSRASRDAVAEVLGARMVTADIVSCDQVNDGKERSRFYAERVAEIAYKNGIVPRGVGVIATRPDDIEMTLAFGISCALEDARAPVCSAADACFPSRVSGGLELAVGKIMSYVDLDQN